MKLRKLKTLARCAVTLAVAAAIVLGGAASAFAAGAYEKRPGGTNAEIANSVFYIAVATGENGSGERLYYYFTLNELKKQYGVETRDFDYSNHTVGTTTSAHGFPVVKLAESLVDAYGEKLPVADSWKIQYLEEDAYHATGAMYIDTIAAARDTTKPMLTFETKTTYTKPTKYNVNDAAYKWAEDLYPEYLRVYRQADSANESIMKMIQGAALSPDGSAFNSATAGTYLLRGLDAEGNNLVFDSKGKPGRSVKGVFKGMKINVPAPTVPAYTTSTASQFIVDVDAATASSFKVATFRYVPTPNYLTVKDWASGTSKTLVQNQVATVEGVRTIPESLEAVQALVAGGDAAEVTEELVDPVTAEFTFTLPKRLLFIDKRVTPNAYGYTDLNLYRYKGATPGVFVGASAAAKNLVATSTTGAKKLYTGAAAASCFVAYQDSHSKACPNNTPESKRFTWIYANPRLVSEYNGEVLVPSLARVDVNAPTVAKIVVKTTKGASSLVLKRGRSASLRATTTPATTVEKLSWSSSNAGLVKVDSRGKVTATKGRTGTATITVKSTFGKKATFKIRVVK